jgi:hypothetical protein
VPSAKRWRAVDVRPRPIDEGSCSATFNAAYNEPCRNLRLFKTTDTLESAMAALATMGLDNQPVKGYSTPAAIGMPMTL